MKAEDIQKIATELGHPLSHITIAIAQFEHSSSSQLSYFVDQNPTYISEFDFPAEKLDFLDLKERDGNRQKQLIFKIYDFRTAELTSDLFDIPTSMPFFELDFNFKKWSEYMLEKYKFTSN
ncbi:hypothetical protein [Weissella cibaria]|uniref:hypothetical protein n=1 Tax=Weissella cibaria TaxID=137591 RepID=UPI00143FAF79|nr:hypothetical protein [Weissella cibaria]NKN30277.1 hypothetical protein [Weissella cibaria]NKN79168.1 hypothetical protein [Weissella cibaria]NKN97096.1 hypothetical protein [Weissella cibaria]NKN99452.1 hypothetical protein [Weissella cibaria]